jgi:putative SOS response-associated peptidase YedK
VIGVLPWLMATNDAGAYPKRSMCGRFTNGTSPEDFSETLAQPLGVLRRETADAGRYNIAPTDPVLAIVAPNGTPEARTLRWALVPAWAIEVRRPPRINATLEGIQRTGTFLGVPADASHRALIVADEFMEWTKAEQKGKVKPAPFGFQVDGGRPFCFAGLWVVNTRIEGGPVASCTLLTCDSKGNAVVSPIHDRMPVILPDPEDWRTWLDPGVSQEEALSICGPLAAERMSARPLPIAFNNTRNKDPEVLFAA